MSIKDDVSLAAAYFADSQVRLLVDSLQVPTKEEYKKIIELAKDEQPIISEEIDYAYGTKGAPYEAKRVHYYRTPDTTVWPEYIVFHTLFFSYKDYLWKAYSTLPKECQDAVYSNMNGLESDLIYDEDNWYKWAEYAFLDMKRWEDDVRNNWERVIKNLGSGWGKFETNNGIYLVDYRKALRSK